MMAFFSRKFRNSPLKRMINQISIINRITIAVNKVRSQTQ